MAGQGWQHALVEVEAVLDRAQQRVEDGVMSELEASIDDVAAQLGLEAAGQFGGKVSTYLKRFNPTLLARLVEQSKLKQ